MTDNTLLKLLQEQRKTWFIVTTLFLLVTVATSVIYAFLFATTILFVLLLSGVISILWLIYYLTVRLLLYPVKRIDEAIERLVDSMHVLEEAETE